MPNIKSAKIRVKQNEKKRIRNKAVKTFVRHLRRDTYHLISEKTVDLATAQIALNEFKKQIDKAWSKGILHRNTSSRIKSSMEILFKKTYTV